jgi:hypothetical protein
MSARDQHIAEAVRLIKRQPKGRPYQSRRGAANQRQDRQDQQTAMALFRSDGVVRLLVH